MQRLQETITVRSSLHVTPQRRPQRVLDTSWGVLLFDLKTLVQTVITAVEDE